MKAVSGLKKKILLIEDEPFMLDLIVMVLEKGDYEVDGAKNGAKALQLLRGGSEYVAIICDMYLPDTDGLIFFEQVHNAYPEVPFLILTSETNEAIVQKIIDLEIPYILKNGNFAQSILAALKK